MIIAPQIEKALAKNLNLNEDNAVMISQAVLVAYVVKTCISKVLRFFLNQISVIRSTGAIMNPLLSILINFHCISTTPALLQHAATYWAGPVAINVIMGLFKNGKISSKKKSD